ncbi:MAG: SRPBCC family protein [Candidatus Nanopelagicales bacterium]|nr:SRPBCC family protein [Candidatus Nanopelagicales bacterium]MCU0296225.1 SRPBCC family protein [Candidatus Nanopelagicales bacterium]MCU0297234.1 SRPBCC family protein [Candidatus Nanopelagicales bacterium]
MADQTESSIVIDAPAERVMGVIADLGTYPEWAGVKSTRVLAVFPDGRPREVEMTIDSGPIKDVYTIAYQWRGDREVNWHLTESTVLRDLVGTYTVVDLGTGSCEVTYRLMVDLTIPIIGTIKRKAEKVIVDTALKGLKRRVEG